MCSSSAPELLSLPVPLPPPAPRHPLTPRCHGPGLETEIPAMVGRLNPEAPSPYLYPEPTDRLRPPYHSVIGDRGKNRDAKSESSDGVVPYWSSHFDGAQSEKIVPSNHSAHTNPEAIAEFKRILRLLLGR